MLDAAEIAQIRADVVAVACDLPCVIQRNTGGVGNKPVWTVISPPGLLAGMAEPTAGMLQNYEYMLGDAASWHIHLPYGTQITEMDQLLVTNPAGVTKTLTCVKVLDPRSYAMLVSVLANE